MDSKNTLRYADERDKSYGVAGMAIAVVAYDREDALAAVDMDADSDHSIEFGNEFYFYANPRMSAKIAWTEILKQFRLATGLLVANAISRSYVQHRRRLAQDTIDAMRDAVRECGLSDDVQLVDEEIDAIFDRNIDFFDSLFQRQATHDAANALAADLMSHRRLSAAETIDRLAGMMRFL
ncbi:MAG: hypothetical protein K2M12_06885 [Muribaculaceae bacterium]|nr:hypothetical protein [Muribaculaceae bacterium]